MKTFLSTLLFLLASCSSNDKTSLPEIVESHTNSEQLFKMCASCHKPDKDFTGPELKGSLQRWGGDKKALYAFIRNPSKSISEKNPYAMKVFKKYNNTQMTAFPFLTDAQIDTIMNYCENYKATR